MAGSTCCMNVPAHIARFPIIKYSLLGLGMKKAIERPNVKLNLVPIAKGTKAYIAIFLLFALVFVILEIRPPTVLHMASVPKLEKPTFQFRVSMWWESPGRGTLAENSDHHILRLLSLDHHSQSKLRAYMSSLFLLLLLLPFLKKKGR